MDTTLIIPLPLAQADGKDKTLECRVMVKDKRGVQSYC